LLCLIMICFAWFGVQPWLPSATFSTKAGKLAPHFFLASFVHLCSFRPSSDDFMIEKCLSGFHCVASAAAYYKMSDVMDNIVASLAKFSTLQNVTDTAFTFVPLFGKKIAN